jgi:hypothetical protein
MEGTTPTQDQREQRVIATEILIPLLETGADEDGDIGVPLEVITFWAWRRTVAVSHTPPPVSASRSSLTQRVRPILNYG